MAVGQALERCLGFETPPSWRIPHSGIWCSGFQRSSSFSWSTHFRHTRTDFNQCCFANTVSCMVHQRRKYPWDLVHLELVNVLLFPSMCSIFIPSIPAGCNPEMTWHVRDQSMIMHTTKQVKAAVGCYHIMNSRLLLINGMLLIMYNKQFVFLHGIAVTGWSEDRASLMTRIKKKPNKTIKHFFVHLRARLFFMMPGARFFVCLQTQPDIFSRENTTAGKFN